MRKCKQGKSMGKPKQGKSTRKPKQGKSMGKCKQGKSMGREESDVSLFLVVWLSMRGRHAELFHHT